MGRNIITRAYNSVKRAFSAGNARRVVGGIGRRVYGGLKTVGRMAYHADDALPGRMAYRGARWAGGKLMGLFKGKGGSSKGKPSSVPQYVSRTRGIAWLRKRRHLP